MTIKLSELRAQLDTSSPDEEWISQRDAAFLLEIVEAALAFQERWETADFEDDTKPARQAMFAALAKVTR